MRWVSYLMAVEVAKKVHVKLQLSVLAQEEVLARHRR